MIHKLLLSLSNQIVDQVSNQIADQVSSDAWGNYLLQGLVETPPPESISWWPSTLGWQLLFAFILIKSIKGVISFWRRYLRNRYRRQALAIIKQLPEQYHIDTLDAFRQLPRLLRWVALQAYHSEQIVTLDDADWEKWLDQQCRQCQFQRDCAGILFQLSFHEKPHVTPAKIQQLKQHIILWIKHHRGLDA